MLKKSTILSIVFCCFFSLSKGQEPGSKTYIIESEANIGKEQSGPHKGGGSTIGYSFFNNIDDFNTVFRKRVLKPGAAIGYHEQKEDEVYYIASGNGEMKLNGKIYEVKSGDAILTRPGGWHGIKNTSEADLVIFIVYEKHKKN
ncbi:cupin domain-containing protein [Pseudoxanthomonas sp. SGD-10]|nr:cupin domain-containing protein [Pseudoxanthomonas sp. SGD-10]